MVTKGQAPQNSIHSPKQNKTKQNKTNERKRKGKKIFFFKMQFSPPHLHNVMSRLHAKVLEWSIEINKINQRKEIKRKIYTK